MTQDVQRAKKIKGSKKLKCTGSKEACDEYSELLKQQTKKKAKVDYWPPTKFIE
jgi:hypothetical protein